MSFLANSSFICLEEPGLEKRFGAEYVEYKKHVPPWIPRIKAWRPAPHKTKNIPDSEI